MESSKISRIVILLTVVALTTVFAILNNSPPVEYESLPDSGEATTTNFSIADTRGFLMSILPSFDFVSKKASTTEREVSLDTIRNDSLGTESSGRTSAESEKVVEEETKPNIVQRVIEKIIPKKTVEPPPPQPPVELRLEKFYYYNSTLVETDPISFAANIANIIEGHSATGTLLFTFDKNNDGTESSPLAERIVYPLIPNEKEVIFWKNALLPTPGTHKASVCLYVDGYYEAVSCETLIFTVIPQESDLVVRSISILPENQIAGEFVTVSAVVKNKGKGNAAHAVTSLRIDAQNNGSWDIVASELELNNLNGGETTTLEWTSVWRTVKGFNRLEVCTDTNNELIEADSQNNCRSSIFNVKAGIYTGLESVQFTIEDGTVSPSTLSVIPGGVVIFANRDFESYAITGDLGSIYIEPETETSAIAPLYTGVYTFYTLYGIELEGTVVVE